MLQRIFFFSVIALMIASVEALLMARTAAAAAASVDPITTIQNPNSIVLSLWFGVFTYVSLTAVMNNMF